MADWYGSARSNYFSVKDMEAFAEMVETSLPGVEVQEAGPENNDDRQGKVCLVVGADSDDGGWPSCLLDEDGVELEDTSLPSLIAPILLRGRWWS